MTSKLTPMMIQYREVKEKYKDCILFFRLGDFYEMFFEDALIASKELEITLTGRNCGLEERAPMCGVPFHSAESYVVRLVEKGYKVAICEQTEDPKDAVGIVKRDVTRIITPGTIIEGVTSDDKRNRYIMSLYKEGACWGICTADTGTGEIYCTQIIVGATSDKVINETAKFKPAEIIINSEADNFLSERLKKVTDAFIYPVENELFDRKNALDRVEKQFKKVTNEVKMFHIGINATGALLLYLDKL